MNPLQSSEIPSSPPSFVSDHLSSEEISDFPETGVFSSVSASMFPFPPQANILSLLTTRAPVPPSNQMPHIDPLENPVTAFDAESIFKALRIKSGLCLLLPPDPEGLRSDIFIQGLSHFTNNKNDPLLEGESWVLNIFECKQGLVPSEIETAFKDSIQDNALYPSKRIIAFKNFQDLLNDSTQQTTLSLLRKYLQRQNFFFLGLFSGSINELSLHKEFKENFLYSNFDFLGFPSKYLVNFYIRYKFPYITEIQSSISTITGFIKLGAKKLFPQLSSPEREIRLLKNFSPYIPPHLSTSQKLQSLELQIFERFAAELNLQLSFAAVSLLKQGLALLYPHLISPEREIDGLKTLKTLFPNHESILNRNDIITFFETLLKLQLDEEARRILIKEVELINQSRQHHNMGPLITEIHILIDIHFTSIKRHRNNFNQTLVVAKFNLIQFFAFKRGFYLDEEACHLLIEKANHIHPDLASPLKEMALLEKIKKFLSPQTQIDKVILNDALTLLKKTL